LKEKIYTIPITEAFAQDSECPFCALFRKLESDAVGFILGPAYMDDDVRLATNEAGFCREHYRQLYDAQNRLGLALMLHTHLIRINQLISKAVPDLPGKRGKNGGPGLAAGLRRMHDSCYVCEWVEGNFGHCVENFFYMWQKMPEFAGTVKNCRGFCLEHFIRLMEAGEKLLPAGDYARFAAEAVHIERDALAKLENDLGRFIAKYDYRNADMPWDGAQDAVLRGLERIASVRDL